MIPKRREIFIKIKKLKEIIEILSEIDELENQTRELFYKFDKLNKLENKVFENWSFYLEDISQKVDYLTL